MAVLVAFGTSGGSTGGIAERVAARLRQHGIAAEARPVTDRVAVASYDAVVLGSAVHGAKWLPTAARFAKATAELLRERPIWLFSVSTIGDEESMFPPRVAKNLRQIRRETEELTGLRALLRAREHRNFAGAIMRSDWPPAGRMFFARPAAVTATIATGRPSTPGRTASQQRSARNRQRGANT